MRNLDDSIIYALNISLPTESIKARTSSDPERNCQELFEKLKTGYAERDKVIKECIQVSAEQVKVLKKQREENANDMNLEKKFKTEQRKLRVLKQEQGVEDIVKDRTFKAFNERCRQFYVADSF